MMAIGRRAIFSPAKMLRRGRFLEKPGRGTRDVECGKVKTEILGFNGILSRACFVVVSNLDELVLSGYHESRAELFRGPRSASRVPMLFPINTSRRTIIHRHLDFIFRCSGRIVDDCLAVIVAMIMVIFVHPEYLGAELGADFAADTAIRIYSWCA
jgi:hypothetical protein